MPRKIVFTKEQIIDAAFDIADTEGFDQLSARKLASALNSSVAPIYANFSDFDDLKKKVVEKINRVALDLAVQSSSGNPLKDIGTASIRFAFQHPKLFHDYIFGKFAFDKQDDMNAYVLKSIKEDEQLSLFSEAEIMEYLEKIRTYQMGLSILAANRFAQTYSESQLVQMLDDMSSDIIFSIKHKRES